MCSSDLMDKKDCQVIARFGVVQSRRLWQPEADEICLLRALIARLVVLDKDIQREKNRLER